MKAHPILRVSSKAQSEQGQGLESQYAYLQHWLQQHPQFEVGEPLELDGYSAYSQKHLPLIRQFVESLPPSSTIVFSEVSRLARMPQKQSFELLFWILNQGVSVAFASINTIIQAGGEIEAMTMQQLVMMFELSRSESAIKSLRINNTFKIQLEQLRAGTRIKKTGLPKWVKLVDGAYYVSDYDKETITTIYNLKLSGTGCYNIVKHLQETNRTTFKGIKNWSYSYVNDILKSRNIIGEYQPVETTGKKRKPKGEPIKGFYPRVISDDLFNQVQATFRHDSKGSKSTTFNNLYRGVLRCFECGGSMSINRTAYGAYIRCEHKKNKQSTCTNKSIKYTVLDDRISDFLRSFDFSLVSTGKPSHEAIRGQLEQVQQRINQVSTAIATVGSDIPELANQLTELSKNRNDLQQQLLVPSATPTDPTTINKTSDPELYNKCIRDLFASVAISPRYTKFTFNDLLNQGLPTVTVDWDNYNESIDVMKMVMDNYKV